MRSRIEQISRRREELAERKARWSTPTRSGMGSTQAEVQQSENAMRGAWQHALPAFETAAETHELVADRYEELVRRSVGDREQCLRRAAEHREAAAADRRRAAQMRAAGRRRAGRRSDQP